MIIDFGIFSPIKKSRSYAALKGLIDAGINTNHKNEGIFPEESRLIGTDIQNYFNKINTIESNQFLSYKKKNLDLNKITIVHKEIKNLISKET